MVVDNLRVVVVEMDYRKLREIPSDARVFVDTSAISPRRNDIYNPQERKRELMNAMEFTQNLRKFVSNNQNIYSVDEVLAETEGASLEGGDYLGGRISFIESLPYDPVFECWEKKDLLKRLKKHRRDYLSIIKALRRGAERWKSLELGDSFNKIRPHVMKIYGISNFENGQKADIEIISAALCLGDNTGIIAGDKPLLSTYKWCALQSGLEKNFVYNAWDKELVLI